jgi:hypothetical protein
LTGADENREGYVEYRRYLTETHVESARSFDRVLFALSGGALGLSITFVDRFVQNEHWTWLLVVAWALFALSLLANLFSVHYAERDFFRSVAAVDRAYVEDKFPQGIEMNRFENRVPTFNLIALWLFVIGTGVLIWFTALNMIEGGK